MQFIRSPVSTVCIGMAASMGSLLLTAGAAGKRYALPNARVMVHQPSGGAQGQATDIEIQAREILTLRRRLNEIYVKHTGQPVEAIEAKLERDSYMSADEALAFGLIDQVVEQRPGRRRAGENLTHQAELTPCQASASNGKPDFPPARLGVYHSPTHPSGGQPGERGVGMSKSGDSKNTLYCSFCGKSQHEVRKLIAGPTVFICDECVELCMDIIREEHKTHMVKTRDGVPTPRRSARSSMITSSGRTMRRRSSRSRCTTITSASPPGRRTTTSRSPRATSCCLGRLARARRCSPRRWRASWTCPSPWPMRRR
jgi:hypothetical protein